MTDEASLKEVVGLRSKVSVLILIFKREELTRKVMSAIREYRPARLYVAADGPRAGYVEEGLCEATRRAAMDVDWECDVNTLFRESNLGLRKAVSEALDWFFGQEEEGVILEDDCVPVPEFWRYCEELLERYRHDERIMAISGSNYQRGKRRTPYSYYFSKHPHCWGWASWRRAWKYYDRGLESLDLFDNSGGFELWSDGSKVFAETFRRKFRSVRKGTLDSWYYCWTFSCWAQNGLTCIPGQNLIKNIGFGPDSTHTKSLDSWLADMQTGKLSFPLQHPPILIRNIAADSDTAVHVEGIGDSQYVKWGRLQRILNPLRSVKHRLVKWRRRRIRAGDR